jgi:hypothetical protein
MLAKGRSPTVREKTFLRSWWFCADLAEALRLLASALPDLAGDALERGEPLPRPDPSRSDPDADLEEPIHLHLQASTGAEVVPAGVVVP